MAAYDTTAYEDMKKRYAASVDQQTASQKEAAEQAAQAQLRQAFITRVQSENAMRNNLARAGIRGGATETAGLRIANNYGNARGTINASLAESKRAYDLAGAQNKLAYDQDIDAQSLAYIQNREAEDRANAREDELTQRQWEHDAQVTAEQRAYEDRIRAEENARADAAKKEADQKEQWTAKYSKYYSNKKLKAALKKATSAAEKAIINARIGWLKENKKLKD